MYDATRHRGAITNATRHRGGRAMFDATYIGVLFTNKDVAI